MRLWAVTPQSVIGSKSKRDKLVFLTESEIKVCSIPLRMLSGRSGP